MTQFKIAIAIGTLMALASTAQAGDDFTRSIRVSPDGHFLTQPDGEPFFWLGDVGWSVFTRLTREEADHYLRDRAKKGFTVIQAVAAGAPYDDLNVPNRYGAHPFIDQDPSRPNPAYFEHVDWVVKRAAAQGIRFALLPIWSLTQISSKNLFTPATAREYGKWIAHRYQGQGIIWVLGGDVLPVWHADFYGSKFVSLKDSRPIYDALAEGLSQGEGNNAFITYHPAALSLPGAARPRTSLYFSDRPWLTMNMLQSGHMLDGSQSLALNKADFVYDTTRNYEPIAEEYGSLPVRPVVDGEPRFEDLAVNIDSKASKGYWSGYDARNAAYHAVFAGAAGHTYGNHSIWQFYERGGKYSYELPRADVVWKDALERPAAAQMQFLKALLLSRPYFTRVPDQSIIAADAGEGTAHISATRDRQGDYAMIYLPQGQAVAIDTSKLSGNRLTAWWYDPRTGAAARVRNETARADVQTFTPPSSGPEDDWVLVLDNETKGFLVPGVQRSKGRPE